MKCHISQPRIYPHISYLNKIANVDLFVVLEDVMLKPELFERRNRYWNFNANEPRFLTVPTTKGAFHNETRITDIGFAKKHRTVLNWNYRKHKDVPFFDEKLLEYLVFDAKSDSFTEYFYEQLKRLLELFDIRTEVVSSLPCRTTMKSVYRLNEILEYYRATEYLSGCCGRDYIGDKLNVPVTYHDTESSFRSNPYTDTMLMYIDSIFFSGLDRVKEAIHHV